MRGSLSFFAPVILLRPALRSRTWGSVVRGINVQNLGWGFGGGGACYGNTHPGGWLRHKLSRSIPTDFAVQGTFNPLRHPVSVSTESVIQCCKLVCTLRTTIQTQHKMGRTSPRHFNTGMSRISGVPLRQVFGVR